MTKNPSYKEAMERWRMKRRASMLRLRNGKKKYSLAEIGRRHGGLSRQRVYKILKSEN